jgi:hypothetical protein
VRKKPVVLSTEQRYIESLERQVEFFRSQHLFLSGKVERLELATMRQGSPAAQDYVARTEEPAIETVVTEPKQLPFNKLKEKWASMTEAEQEAAIAKGAN